MSDLELERAAMAPRRWIKLCSAFQKQHSNNSDEILRPRKAGVVDGLSDIIASFIVPGGRYLVTAGYDFSVWDLGYVSNVDCKLIASVEIRDEFDIDSFMVQTTPDGRGLVFLSGTFL